MPPIATAFDPRAYFLPYQIRWICDDHPVAVAEKSRRIGFTHASAFRAVDRRLRLGTDLFYTSADLSAAREFAEDCCRWARAFNAAVRDEGERAIDDAGITAFSLRFANGARIVAGSSSPTFFRGKGGDADADEFAFHERPRELYKAMQPTALIWGHQLRLWSTHNGSGSFFHRLVQSVSNGDLEPGAAATARGLPTPVASPAGDGAAPTLPPPAMPDGPDADALDLLPITGQRPASHRVTLLDAVSQGLVERLRNLPAPDLTARRDFVEEVRASCPDDEAFREEYLCQPAPGGPALIPRAAVGACEATNLRLADVEALAAGGGGGDGGERAGPLYAGFHVGRRGDGSVLWMVERVGDALWTRCLRVAGGGGPAEQAQALERLLSNRRVGRACVDAAGIGPILAERLRRRHGDRAVLLRLTADARADLAVRLARLFAERRVWVPPDPAVRADLRAVRRTESPAYRVRLAAPADPSADAGRFWALALACHAAGLGRARVPPSAPRG